jgi:hypothetical protein
MDKLSYSSWKPEFKHYPIDRWFWAAVVLICLARMGTEIKSTTLICNRFETGSDSCKVLLKTLLQPKARQIREFPIAALEKAELDRQPFSKYDRIYLRFKDQQNPLILSGANTRRSLQSELFRINAFINSDTKSSLEVEDGVKDFQFFYIALSMQAGFILSVLAFSGRVLLATFDRSTQQFTLQRLGLWKRAPLNHQLADISRAELEAKKPGFGRKGSYRPNVVLTSQQKVPLTTVRGFSERNRRNLQASCDRINQFLNS